MRYVYLFHEGNARMKELLGARGQPCGNDEPSACRFPVAWTMHDGRLPGVLQQRQDVAGRLVEEVTRNLKAIEEEAGKRFGGRG